MDFGLADLMTIVHRLLAMGYSDEEVTLLLEKAKIEIRDEREKRERTAEAETRSP